MHRGDTKDECQDRQNPVTLFLKRLKEGSLQLLQLLLIDHGDLRAMTPAFHSPS
jgi:hypothetical protein